MSTVHQLSFSILVANSIFLSACGGSGGSDGGNTTANNSSASEILGNYSGNATIMVNDSWGTVSAPPLSTTCQLKSPLKVNDVEKETNDFNLSCGTTNANIIGGFGIHSAALYPVAGYPDKLLVQSWTFTKNNQGFDGKLTSNNSNTIGSIANNFFTAREVLPGMQSFLAGTYRFCDSKYSQCKQATLNATYYSSNNSINIKLRGQGISMTNSGANSGLAEIIIDMTLTKSY